MDGAVMERRAAALAQVDSATSPDDLQAALGELEETVVAGLSLPPAQLAQIAGLATHPDSAVRLAWARVMLRRVWRTGPMAAALPRLIAWTEAAGAPLRDQRRDQWVALARALPGTPATPLMDALFELWRRADDDRAEGLLGSLESFATVVRLPAGAAAEFASAVQRAVHVQTRNRLIGLWARAALTEAQPPADAGRTARSWLRKRDAGMDDAVARRLVQVVAQFGGEADARAVLDAGDAMLDAHLANCLAPRLAGAAGASWIAGLLAGICARHGGGAPCHAALAALRRAAGTGADLGDALPVLLESALSLDYDRDPWPETPDPDMRSDLARSSARRDALLIATAIVMRAGGDPGPVRELAAALGSLEREDLADELRPLDRWLGKGSAAEARRLLAL